MDGAQVNPRLRPIAGLPWLVTFLAAATLARGGDKEAHTEATYQADAVVGREPQFANGIGGPLVDGGALTAGADGAPPSNLPRFLIPSPPNVAECDYGVPASMPAGCVPATCSYSTTTSYENSCGDVTDMGEGEAVNEPDYWACLDPREPPMMIAANAFLSPGQSAFASVLTLIPGASAAAMACNWNHFASNPGLESDPNNDASSALSLTLAWADELPSSIEAGAGELCTIATWKKYLHRVDNALHFAQDATCEHHALGNVVCNDSSANPIFVVDPLYDFSSNTCLTWLLEASGKASGTSPSIPCDQAVVVSSTPPNVTLNTKMSGLLLGCTIGSSIACMGLERTLRHHCGDSKVVPDVEVKSIRCAGAENGHTDSLAPGGTWCEGEPYRAGGQDFLQSAWTASQPILEQTAKRWATVCKEPDDPCDPAQCDTWCLRSAGATQADAGSSVAPLTQGYCLNDQPDPACVLHKCRCGTIDECGATGQPCCIAGPRCTDPGTACSAATGKCGAPGDAGPACASAALTDASPPVRCNADAGGPSEAVSGIRRERRQRILSPPGR